MTTRYSPLYANFIEWDDPLNALVTASDHATAALSLFESAEVIKKWGQITRGRATFRKQPYWDELAVEGRIVSLYQHNAILNAGFVFPFREMGAFLVQKVKEGVDRDGRETVEMSGMGMEHLLTKYRHWAPIGEETIYSTTLAATAIGPTATTLAVGAPHGNKSCTVVSTDGFDVGDEIRLEMGTPSGSDGIHVSRLTGIEEPGWNENQVTFLDRMPYDAPATNDVEVRTAKLRLTSVTGMAVGMRVRITLDSAAVHETLIIKVEGADREVIIRDGLPSPAANGKAVVAYDYSEPATDDVTQIIAPAAADGWAIEFDSGSYDGTATGTTHAPAGDSAWDLLSATAQQTGEFFRIQYLGDGHLPRKLLKWQRAHVDSSITLWNYADTASVAVKTEDVNSGIIYDLYRERESDIITRLYPVASDGRISFAYCSEEALADAATAGFTVVISTDLYQPDYIEHNAGVTAHGVLEETVRYGNITLSKDGPVTELQAASNAMLLQSMTTLNESQNRTYWRCRAQIHRPVFPGQYLTINNQGTPLGAGSESPNYTTLYILEVRETYSAADQGVIMTSLLLSEEPFIQPSAVVSLGEHLRATSQSSRRQASNDSRSAVIKIETGGSSTITDTESYIFNVLDYGADRSGTEDATASIQTTVNKAIAAGGGTVFFPAGTYLMNSGGVTLGNKVTLEGAGRLETVVKRTNSQTTSMFAYEPTSASMSGVTIQDMTISSSSAETHCVRLGVDDGYEIQNTMLRNVLISNPYDAQYARCLLINGMTRNVDVDNCIFIGCETPTTNQSRNWQYTVMVGVGPNQCGPGHTIVFRDCLFKYGQIGLNVTATSNTPTAGRTQALTIDNCEWEGQTVIGLRLYHGQGYRITNCNFHNIKTYPTAAQLADTEYGTNWPVEPAAAWLDMIHADGGADQYRGAVAVISDNLFRNIEGTALYVEDASNHVISGNSISFVTKRTGAQASIASIDPTGFTSVGGVGLFIGKGKQRPMIVGNSIHYCEHAGIRASIGFGPPTFTDESDYYWFIGNRIHKCGDYGIRMDGHFNTTINISNNQIEGDPAGIWTSGSNTAGIFFTKSAAQSSTGLGIARFICMGNMITGSTYGVYKDYEMAAGSTGQALQMVGNTINCTGTYAVYWRGANGNVTSNNFHGKSTSFTKGAGGYNPTFIQVDNGDGNVSTENDNQWLQATTFKTTTGALTLKTDSGALQLQSTGGPIAMTPSGGNVTVSQDVIVAGGLGVGHASAEPDAGEIWLYNGGQGKLRRTGANVEWWNGSAWQDLTLAAEASSNPGASSLVLKTDASGLLQVAGLGVNHTPGISQFTVGGMIKTTSALLSGVDMTYSGGPGQLILDRATNAGVAILLDSDAGHGITGPMVSTDTFLQVSESNTTGGVNIEGANSAGQGILLTGYAGTSSTSRTATAPVTVYGYKVTSSVQDADADQNVFAIRTQRSGVNRTVFVVDEDGDIHVDGSSTVNTFDDYDDTALVRAADLALAGHDIDSEFGRLVRYNRADLEAAKIISIEDDGTIYLNTTRMQRLLSGAVWQLAERVKALEARLT